MMKSTQDMVTQSNLLAAISDTDAWKRVAMQNSNVITSLELRLGRLRHELACEQVKTVHFQSALREMTVEIDSFQDSFQDEVGSYYKQFSGLELELAEARSKFKEMCSKSELSALQRCLVAAEEQQALERSEFERALADMRSLLASRNQENADLLSSSQVHCSHSKRLIRIDG